MQNVSDGLIIGLKGGGNQVRDLGATFPKACTISLARPAKHTPRIQLGAPSL